MPQLAPALFITAAALAGMAVVFLLLIALVKLLVGWFPWRGPARQAVTAPLPMPGSLPQPSDSELQAVILSSIAHHLGCPPSDIRIVSIRLIS